MDDKASRSTSYPKEARRSNRRRHPVRFVLKTSFTLFFSAELQDKELKHFMTASTAVGWMVYSDCSAVRLELLMLPRSLIHLPGFSAIDI